VPSRCFPSWVTDLKIGHGIQTTAWNHHIGATGLRTISTYRHRRAESRRL